MSKFNFNIDAIKDNENQNSMFKSKYNSITQKELYEFNQYIVDLNLPSGTKWYKYNLGVDPNKLDNAKDWIGDLYGWGELIPNKDDYNQLNYRFTGISKYNEDRLTQLELEDDAAYQNLHIYKFEFQIPTKKQFDELIKYTTNNFVENYNDIIGLNGWIFKGKNNSELFLPTKQDERNVAGYYWTSNLDKDNLQSAWDFRFGPNGCYTSNYATRCAGFFIHPVLLN